MLNSTLATNVSACECDAARADSSRYNNLRAVFNALAAFTLLLVTAAAGQAAEVKILALGDSLTAGYGLKQKDSFPAQLAAALQADGLDVRVTNAGVSGDTSAGGLARIGWLLQDVPDVAIVELGANDGLRGIDPAETMRNLGKIIETLKAKNIRVVLAGMLAPPNMGPRYGAAFDAVFPTLASQHSIDFYPFFLDGVAADAALNQADGIHPNARGVEIIVRRILPTIKRALNAQDG